MVEVLAMTTAAELIEMLRKHSPDMVVHLEGCDCINEATWIKKWQPYQEPPALLIGVDLPNSMVKEPQEPPESDT